MMESADNEEWFGRRRCSTMARQCFDKSIIKDKPVIWLMGPTGSGKGTQCDKLFSKYGLTPLSSGELMRTEVLEGTDRCLIYEKKIALKQIFDDYLRISYLIFKFSTFRKRFFMPLQLF